MRKQILCLCTAILLLFSGCDNPTTEQNSNNSTASATTTLASTTTASATTTATNHGANTTTTTTESSQSATSNSSGTHQTTITTTLNGNITTQAVTTTQSTAIATTVAAPEEITFKATVRVSGQSKALEGIMVTVYTNGNPIPAGSGKTDAKGVANITLLKSNSYRVVLSNLPNGYEANEEYIFASSTVNIIIRKAAVQNEADHSQAQYAVGKKMTNFTLTDTEGNTYKLYDLLEENQLIVLDFWFTTCEPCKNEFPYFEAVANKYSDKMKLLAINPINDANSITRFRKQLNTNSKTAVTFPMMRDTCNIYLGFGVSTYPTTVFIDSSGIIRDIHIGAYDSEMAFLTAVKRYLR